MGFFPFSCKQLCSPKEVGSVRFEKVPVGQHRQLVSESFDSLLINNNQTVIQRFHTFLYRHFLNAVHGSFEERPHPSIDLSFVRLVAVAGTWKAEVVAPMSLAVARRFELRVELLPYLLLDSVVVSHSGFVGGMRGCK